MNLKLSDLVHQRSQNLHLTLNSICLKNRCFGNFRGLRVITLGSKHWRSSNGGCDDSRCLAIEAPRRNNRTLSAISLPRFQFRFQIRVHSVRPPWWARKPLLRSLNKPIWLKEKPSELSPISLLYCYIYLFCVWRSLFFFFFWRAGEYKLPNMILLIE